MARRRSFRMWLGLSVLAVAGVVAAAIAFRDDVFEKRVHVIRPGQLVRGAWQRSSPMRRIIDREGINTIVTLTAINQTDEKFIDQKEVVEDKGIDWIIIPMRGSRATMEQMAIAADLLADPKRQPVYFHCVAGHHRTSLAHAAYLIRHEGYTAEQAWEVVSGLEWARPDAPPDQNDRFLIEEFARTQASLTSLGGSGNGYWEVSGGERAKTVDQKDSGGGRDAVGDDRGLGRLEPGERELRDGAAKPGVPIGSNVGGDARPNPS